MDAIGGCRHCPKLASVALRSLAAHGDDRLGRLIVKPQHRGRAVCLEVPVLDGVSGDHPEVDVRSLSERARTRRHTQELGAFRRHVVDLVLRQAEVLPMARVRPPLLEDTTVETGRVPEVNILLTIFHPLAGDYGWVVPRRTPRS